MGKRTNPAVAAPPLTLITLCAAVTVICLGLVAGQMDWDDDEDPGKFVFLSIAVQPDPLGGLKLCLSAAASLLRGRNLHVLSSCRLGTSYSSTSSSSQLVPISTLSLVSLPSPHLLLLPLNAVTILIPAFEN